MFDLFIKVPLEFWMTPIGQQPSWIISLYVLIVVWYLKPMKGDKGEMGATGERGRDCEG